MLSDLDLLNQFSIKFFLFALNITIKGMLLIVFLSFFIKAFKKISPNCKYFIWFLTIFLIPLILTVSITLNTINHKTNKYNIITNLNLGIINISSNINRTPIKNVNQNIINDNPEDSIDSIASQNNSKLHWSLLFFIIWSAGFLLLIIYFITGYIKLIKFIKKLTIINNNKINKIINKFKTKHKIKKDIIVYITDKCTVPVTFYYLKNIIILPKYVKKYSIQKLKILLSHELMHIKHNDSITKNIARFICTIFWFIPLIWYAYNELIIEQEKKCDQNIIKKNEINKFEYANEILSFAKINSTNDFSYASIFSYFSKKNFLEQRIQNIIDFKPSEFEKYIKNTWKIISIFSLLFLPLLIVNPFKITTQKEILNNLNKEFDNTEISYNQLSKKHIKDIKSLPVLWPLLDIKKIDANILEYMNSIIKENGLELKSSYYKDYYDNSFTKRNKEYLDNGIFILDKDNTPIVASADGVIEEIKSQYPWGIQVVIKHKNGLKSVYSYIDSLSDSIIKSHKKVYQGQIIGYPLKYYGKYQEQKFSISYFYYTLKLKSKFIHPYTYLYYTGKKILLKNNI